MHHPTPLCATILPLCATLLHMCYPTPYVPPYSICATPLPMRHPSSLSTAIHPQVSTVMSDGPGGRNKPKLSITSLVMQFGQFVDHDLTHTPESAGEGCLITVISHIVTYYVLLPMNIRLT